MELCARPNSSAQVTTAGQKPRRRSPDRTRPRKNSSSQSAGVTAMTSHTTQSGADAPSSSSSCSRARTSDSGGGSSRMIRPAATAHADTPMSTAATRPPSGGRRMASVRVNANPNAATSSSVGARKNPNSVTSSVTIVPADCSSRLP